MMIVGPNKKFDIVDNFDGFDVCIEEYELSINNMKIVVTRFDDFKKVVKWFLKGDMSELSDLLESLKKYCIINIESEN